MSCFRALSGRLLDLKRQVDELDGGVNACVVEKDLARGELPNETAVVAQLYLDEAEEIFNGFRASGLKTLSRVAVGRFYEALIRAQVEVDKLVYSEVDPNFGWVEWEVLDCDLDRQDELIVNTQLLRLYLDGESGASIVELDYKPRKANLVSFLHDEMGPTENLQALLNINQLPLLEPAVEVYDVAAGSKKSACVSHSVISLRTPDLLGIKCRQDIEVSGTTQSTSWRTTLVKDFLFKSGIGAHCENATTGFSLAYSFSGVELPPKNTLLAIEWNAMLPTAVPEAISICPLLSVGGISTKERFSGAEKKWLSGEDVEGGLHGVRLIDGVSDLHVDIRASKQLLGVSLVPLFATQVMEEAWEGGNGSDYWGVRAVFVVKLASDSGQFDAVSFFVSIL